MKKRALRFFQYFFFLGGGLFLVWWQLRSMQPAETEEFVHALTQSQFRFIIPVAIMSLLSHISRAMRWKLLMEPLGYKPSLLNAFGVTMVGYLANSAVPRLGEILKCTLLAKYEKLKVDKLVGTIIVERSFDLICFLFFIIATLFLQFDNVSSFFEENIHVSTGTMPIWVKPVIWIIILTLSFFIIRKIFQRYYKIKIVKKISAFAGGVAAGFASIRQLKSRKKFLAHTFFIWTMYLGQIYVGFKGMSGTQYLGLDAAISVLTLASLSMIVTPGGIGSFPIFVMETLLLYNIHAPLGKAFGWLMWGVSTSFIIVFGILCLLILPYYNKKKNEIDTIPLSENI